MCVKENFVDILNSLFMNAFSGFQTKQFYVLQEVVTTASGVWYLVSNVRSASESNSIVLKKYLYLNLFCADSFRYKCHNACTRNAPFSCGLPPNWRNISESVCCVIIILSHHHLPLYHLPMCFQFRILIKNHHKVCVYRNSCIEMCINCFVI